jgi:hypothetical protein
VKITPGFCKLEVFQKSKTSKNPDFAGHRGRICEVVLRSLFCVVEKMGTRKAFISCHLPASEKKDAEMTPVWCSIQSQTAVSFCNRPPPELFRAVWLRRVD